MPNTISLILASSSPRRRELLHNLGLTFTVLPSLADEATPPGMMPHEIVKVLSLRKAQEVARRVESGLVIGSDTIVVLGDVVLGKPSDEAEAFEMIHSLQGREHTVYSGVAIVDTHSGKEEVAYSHTKVKIRPMSSDEIRAYIRTGEPMDKAGSYAIQGIGATLVEGIVGDYFTVVGLPLNLTAEMLGHFDVRIL